MDTKIPFSGDELKRLLNVYEQEERALRQKLKVTQSTLRKLKEALRQEVLEETNLLLTVDEEAKDVVAIKADSKSEKKMIIPKVPASKRGRKPKKKKITKTIPSDFDIAELNWKNFIITSIRNQNEIMSVDMLVDLAIRAYNLKAFPQEEITFHISHTMDELVKNEVVISMTFSDKITYFGYSPWLNPKGELKPEYYSTYKFSADLEEEEEEEQEEMIEINRWQEFIIKVLNKTRKLHTEQEFHTAALAQLDLTTEEKENLEVYIEENIDEMLHSEILKRMPVQAGGYQYALPHWFKKGDGKLKVYYLAHP